MADIRTNDAPAAALAAPPPPAQPADAHADPAAASAATAQHDRLAERLDGQPAPPPAVSPPLAAAPASTTSQPPPSTTSDAPRAVRFRPSATNEWDRMPAEIQNMILEHAGLLTLCISGRIDDTKLSLEHFKSILVEVFELDWKGDLTTLPFKRFLVYPPNESLWRIRTRSMHARVKALGYYGLEDGLDQAAILNGWTDLLDFADPGKIGFNAATCGSIEMLEYLVYGRKVVMLDFRCASLAAGHGQLNVLKWLHERMIVGSWTTGMMDQAAENGHFDCVKWLHANRTEGCTTKAMDSAAKNGHFDLVKWLHENRTEGCTTRAMDQAAENGHFDCFKWLHENPPRDAQPNRTEGCTYWAMDSAAEGGHLLVVEWLHNNRSEGCSPDALNSSARNGFANVVEWLHKNRTEGNIADAAEHAVKYCRLNVIERIHALAPDAITVSLVDQAAFEGRVSALNWIVDNIGIWPTATGITYAVEEGQLYMLPWFHKRMPELLRSHAVFKVGNENADAVIDWFDRDNLPSDPEDVMRLAIRERQVLVVKWMLQHLPTDAWEEYGLEEARQLVDNEFNPSTLTEDDFE
ncbi:hypothetical protein HK105_201791 [Polyrhizophydium stewartii]|uniref:Ankyrin repeat protein n=1 Tax=Polyrhizophydium stewartii TaxID=2732419 RepID=A0ABR4NG12_9FUNG